MNEDTVKNNDPSNSTLDRVRDLEVANKKLKELFEIQRSINFAVSHELRTPLSAIKMAIDIILSGTAGKVTSEQRNFLNKAKNNIDRLKRLIDNILDLSKLEAGKMTINKRLNDLNHLIKDLAGIYEPVAAAKGLKINLELDSMSMPFSFDEDKISQVVSNLINNAIKFTEEGKITVFTRFLKNEKTVRVTVKDTGSGISKEDISKLFQKYTQLGDPFRRKTGGTGLGLAICYEIIRQHDGKIWVESKPGEGIDVIFILPL